MSVNRPQLNIEALKQQIRAEVATHQKTAPTPPQARSLKVSIALRLSHIETLLNAADAKAQPRTNLPPRFNRFPLSLSRGLQKFILRLYHFLFKEQRAINIPVIHAARESLTLNYQLARDLVDLQAQIDQLHNRIASLENQLEEQQTGMGSRKQEQ